MQWDSKKSIFHVYTVLENKWEMLDYDWSPVIQYDPSNDGG